MCNAICSDMAFFFPPMTKVLLGESSGCEPENIVPSKPGLHTVLEVLKIQMKYWPTLNSSFEKLQSQWGMYSTENKSKEMFAIFFHGLGVDKV